MSIQRKVSLYLIAARAYYWDDDPVMTDHDFDALAQELLANYEEASKHPHCPTRDDLKAGTYLGHYPDIVIEATRQYRKRVNEL